MVFPTNFPSEWFYWTGNARIRPLVGSNSFRADLTLALEGTFGGPTGAVNNGDQIVFARFRFRVNGGLVPNATYTVTYPFGVKTFVASTTGTINFTEDQGCGITPPACNFASVLPTTNVGPFLKWDATAPPPPAGFIGDANVTHSVTGSPFNTNFLRIDGPNVGGPGINTIQTNQFTVTGKIFNGVLAAPLTIDRTSYARVATAATEVDLFAHSVGAATIVGSATGLPTTTLTKDATSGRFFARIPLGVGAAPPPFIRYTVTAPGSDPTVRDAPTVDEVTITLARYSVANHTLTVNATSSEQVTPPGSHRDREPARAARHTHRRRAECDRHGAAVPGGGHIVEGRHRHASCRPRAVTRATLCSRETARRRISGGGFFRGGRVRRMQRSAPLFANVGALLAGAVRSPVFGGPGSAERR